MQVPA